MSEGYESDPREEMLHAMYYIAMVQKAIDRLEDAEKKVSSAREKIFGTPGMTDEEKEKWGRLCSETCGNIRAFKEFGQKLSNRMEWTAVNCMKKGEE